MAKFGEWLPIESAPKTGRILGATSNGYTVIVQWQGFDKKWIDASSKRWLVNHWMPLPEPPAPPEGER